ncbi:hypothetical protein BY996DRAFT_6487551 [Phakopsora pachyrhizi]|nr:hypothetical protein BY996DRAFT_6487551 [Phakopsora pachyrhizi]
MGLKLSEQKEEDQDLVVIAMETIVEVNQSRFNDKQIVNDSLLSTISFTVLPLFQRLSDEKRDDSLSIIPAIKNLSLMLREESLRIEMFDLKKKTNWEGLKLQKHMIKILHLLTPHKTVKEKQRDYFQRYHTVIGNQGKDLEEQLNKAGQPGRENSSSESNPFASTPQTLNPIKLTQMRTAG